MVALTLYCPDIPQNTGSMIRLCACMDVPVHIIEPCGFLMGTHKFKRSAMDYIDFVELQKHASWDDYIAYLKAQTSPARKILLTTKTDAYYDDFSFQPTDHLIMGRESAGVPEEILGDMDACIKIPMKIGLRSLNVGMAAAMVIGEALRQTNLLTIMKR